MPNPEKPYAIGATGMAILAAGLIFLPGWVGMDGMNGGYAVSFIAIWLMLSAVLTAWFFWRRAAQIDRMLAGQEILAHWTYTPAEWLAYAGAELEEQLQENRALWYLMAGMSLVTGAAFWLFDREAGLYVFLLMVAMTLVLAVAAFGFPLLRRWRQGRRPGEAWLAPTAVLFDGVFYPIKSRLMWLDGVEWQEAAGTAPACLCFHLTHFVRSGIQTRTLRVPVPNGRTDEALALLEKYEIKPRRRPERGVA